MSYTFSRRDFMKYTALTAVAIAGSGMLTGCSNPNRPVGKTGDTLKPGDGICEATLKSATYNRTTLTCKFEIYTIIVSLQVNQQHFQVNVTGGRCRTISCYLLSGCAPVSRLIW